MKLNVQAQHLQPGDIVGSGETITDIIRNSIQIPTGKVYLRLINNDTVRSVLWGKYTMINVKRNEQ